MSRYLLKIQFFGFRYHGWMKQPNVKTVQGQLDKTLLFLLPQAKMKTLACGRTDAMVSANEHYVELFLDQKISENSFFDDLNRNLPQDIRALEIKEVDESFEVIGDVKAKEYHYLFTDLEMHPFCAGMMTRFRRKLNLDIMKQGAEVFKGTHWFGNYAYRKDHLDEAELVRQIDHSELLENQLYQANFFPERSYLYRITGKGFMRHQVRMMLGGLIMLGEGLWSLDDLQKSLEPGDVRNKITPLIAPASGLILHKIVY